MNTEKFKAEGWKEISQANSHQNKVDIAILKSHRIDLNATSIARVKNNSYNKFTFK